ncbi:DUF881 domain-containing protein [Micromonospora sagamiensis]|uniref:Uncharacterized protein YlxW (UPF0749 family) n=1 Tax=Micromonospora sagamiensis TaxID=47875 RepID=A0A562WG72_9ACTN|nr:DUF881 domain-containing protein [Micromonospora sagamiensis]TWJ29172.1 uncharacterized protein YlxW (UPF0749 family) [Micromonospora sagamiensis]BCL17803.1 hypothetical protein GCM10017556_55420 [Micromonospora sagamiensis]
MSDEQSGTGAEQTGPSRPTGPAAEPDPRPDAPDPEETAPLRVEPQPGETASDGERSDGAEVTVDLSRSVVAGGAPAATPVKRMTSASVMIAVLLALLGFTLVVQLKTTSTDPTLSAARQEDLVRILSDLDARENRLRQDIAELEESQRQLASGAQGREAALEEAARRADELGILAGTLPATGPGLTIRISGGGRSVPASRILDAVQELRGAGAEAMQISGGVGSPVRIIASTYFLDGEGGGLVVDGRRMTGPYSITVIGDPATMRTALNIPGGVAASIKGDGGNVSFEDREVAEVSALHEPIKLEHARPVS